jgi:hypothetical protein
MTRPAHGPDDRTTAPTGDQAYGTSTDADVTSRMSGTSGVGRHAGQVDAGERRGVITDTSRPAERYEERQRVLPAKTSAAAAFALVFGLAALFCALTGLLAPAAVLFGLIGIVLGVVGRKKGSLPGVTGRGVALGGLVTALLGFLLGAAVLAGAAVLVNDAGALDRVQQLIDDARANLPTGSEIVEQAPGS